MSLPVGCTCLHTTEQSALCTYTYMYAQCGRFCRRCNRHLFLSDLKCAVKPTCVTLCRQCITLPQSYSCAPSQKNFSQYYVYCLCIFIAVAWRPPSDFFFVSYSIQRNTSYQNTYKFPDIENGILQYYVFYALCVYDG